MVQDVKAVEASAAPAVCRTAFPFATAVVPRRTASPPQTGAALSVLASNQYEKAAEAKASTAAAATTADSTADFGAIDTVQTERAAFKNDDFFEEKVKKFEQEGTPSVISGRTSLSNITISDEETVSLKKNC